MVIDLARSGGRVERRCNGADFQNGKKDDREENCVGQKHQNDIFLTNSDQMET